MKLKPDDAFAYRKALEPATHNMVADEDDEEGMIELMSIAISLKRIADALQSKKDR